VADHEAVTHIDFGNAAVSVYSPKPKLKPVMVTEAPPECGALVYMPESTGGSNTKTFDPVPVAAATMPIANPGYCKYPFMKHDTMVAEAQAVVKQGIAPVCACLRACCCALPCHGWCARRCVDGWVCTRVRAHDAGLAPMALVDV
jgi:hypothetical protein